MNDTEIRELLDAHAVAASTGTEIACRCDQRWRVATGYRQHVADALQPTVAQIRAEAVAEALRDAALEWQRLTDGAAPVARFLRSKAAAALHSQDGAA